MCSCSLLYPPQQGPWGNDWELELAKGRHKIPHVVRDDRLGTSVDGALALATDHRVGDQPSARFFADPFGNLIELAEVLP
jgi:hypothetical protein